jgi:2-dehydro-3-deoxygluconokinase
MRVGCVGEAMVELSLADGAAKVGFAGDVLNTAIYLRRELPAEHEVAFVSMIGSDVLSDRMAAFIEGEGLSTRDLQRHPARLPGLYAISTDAAGERSFLYWRDSSAARLMFCSDNGAGFAPLDGYDVVYLSAITLAILSSGVREALFAWIDGFRREGGRLAFDSNYRPGLWPGQAVARDAVARAWRRTDIGLPSVDDEMALFGDADEAAALARLRCYGIRTGALKRGASGPLPIPPTDAPLPDFPPAERVVDTTAAGDSFNGGFLASFLSGGSLADAMLAGHRCAARVVGFRGAIAPREAADGAG